MLSLSAAPLAGGGVRRLRGVFGQNLLRRGFERGALEEIPIHPGVQPTGIGEDEIAEVLLGAGRAPTQCARFAPSLTRRRSTRVWRIKFLI